MSAGEKSAIRCLVAFSTADVDESRRLDYYQDVSRSIYPGVESDLPREGEFNASFKAYALKEAVLTGISVPGHPFKRDERGPRKWNDDTVSLNICAFSNLRAEYAGAEWQLHPGTPLFVDNWLPFFRINTDRRRRMTYNSLIFDRKLLNLEKSGLSPAGYELGDWQDACRAATCPSDAAHVRGDARRQVGTRGFDERASVRAVEVRSRRGGWRPGI